MASCRSMRSGRTDEKVIGVDGLSRNGELQGMREELVVDRPFGQLLHFSAESKRKSPRVLIVSPLSGMRSGLLHDMIAGIFPSHDVYCLTWKDAADVPADEGPFGLEDNIGHVIDALNDIGGRLHLVDSVNPHYPRSRRPHLLPVTPFGRLASHLWAASLTRGLIQHGRIR